jgi:uncharacterized membrane protein YfcA
MRRAVLGFASGSAVGVLGGLIGLGGGEFRLPILTSLFGYAARAAVPLNLVISAITLMAALAARAHTLSLAAVVPHAVEAIALGVGGIVGAGWSARLLPRLSDHRLEHLIAWLLAGIGVLLIVEALLPGQPTVLLSRNPATLIVSGVALGLVIGAVAALLGVAGGELLIPTLMLVYGADIRSAGTASLMISIVTVLSGLLRYGRLAALPSIRSFRTVAVPMGLGSIAGAVIGALLVGLLPVGGLKVLLGAVLIAAASKPLWRTGGAHL